VAHGTGLIPNDTRFPCRTLGACLVRDTDRLKVEGVRMHFGVQFC